MSDAERYLRFTSFKGLDRGPRDDLDAQLPDIFGKSVPLRNFKKWY